MTSAVRGAIQIPENSVSSIEQAATKLVMEILKANGIAENQIVSIMFSLTEDLTAANPAAGLRRTGFASTPLFCAQEPRIDGALPRVIRVLMTWDCPERRVAVPVYLDGAEVLRPDLDPVPRKPSSAQRGSGE
jgi:chorismate mutase